MSTPGVVALAIGAIVVLATAMWMVTRASVPDRLARTDAAGTGHGSALSTHADTGRPADASAEDMLALAGDAAPAPPPPPPAAPPRPARPPERPDRPVDPDAPGRSVDDPGADEAVEPNEPA